jgi:hypothetical protein
MLQVTLEPVSQRRFTLLLHSGGSLNSTRSTVRITGRLFGVATSELLSSPTFRSVSTRSPTCRSRMPVDLAMSITQPGHRIRLETTGVERANLGGYKATIMLATANTSLHGILSTDNTAGHCRLDACVRDRVRAE